jgi:hypothetical protein
MSRIMMKLSRKKLKKL